MLPCRTAGVWLGYVSSVFYLSSRLSQIYKNYARKCTEGLSVAMFLMAISANVRAHLLPCLLNSCIICCPAHICTMTCGAGCCYELCMLRRVQVSYGLGILMRTYSWEDFQVSFPWLLGSLGVVLLDIIISLQVRPAMLHLASDQSGAAHGFSIHAQASKPPACDFIAGDILPSC